MSTGQLAVTHQPGRDGRRREGNPPRVMDSARPRSYYGKPVVAAPVWEAHIAWYFFTGGLAGASAVLGLAADASGNAPLARRAWPVSLAATVVSPVLLILDLGQPKRFYNMLRVFKPTSPMSVGVYILSAMGAAVTPATAYATLGWFPRLGSVGKLAAALIGPALSTYTAVLVADTAVPAWHEAHRELAFVFAGSSMAAAGAAAAALTPTRHSGPARRLAVAGAAVEVASTQIMEHRLGELAEPYSEGAAGRYAKLAKGMTSAGATVIALGGRRRLTAVAGGALVLAGAVCERFAVFHAGSQSANDPKYTVGPQRRRLERREARTGSRSSRRLRSAGNRRTRPRR